jgi:NAD(P)-dependent dehydrogenase (short-subunit alcohol dehydrogenase family)
VGAYRTFQHSWPLSGTPSYRLSGAQRLGQRVEAQRAAHRRVVLGALRGVGLGQVALNQHLLQDVGRHRTDRGRRDHGGVVRHMVPQRRGRIVNLSSVSGLVGSAGHVAYSAKGGINMLTKVVAVELAPHGIRVNAVAPGAVETELSRAAWTPADRTGYMRLTPVERLGQPEEIAPVVVLLCVPQSDYMTGQILVVDGGFSIAGIQ